ncbi:MAG: hypoxanthine phosphoribosyltransferase [candidate division KSB1 bacterium]|nr:hypoxanthine phosphoribosyltransferase [candidate division KSB1 bacterium]MDZ7275307.1 hypoxanthine phosphoribosyltransferase [candidate division KSB1 bacterium]MDZ7287475.1 hypoxanthine phosphoribosyltransferase [candidate division KSB1 bacterium]MDZ7299589.1 hypoxanthine phosphoribosyltransferase [candidate division KSB1 bacterium]MDZ7307473.1 hypoxanthine phosphoribosyltransferase [candidate division KSB1 bacterium]
MTEQTARFYQGHYQVLLSAQEIESKVQELGRQLSADYAGKCPVFIGVLNGSFMFMADLMKAITIDCEVDFIKISSYGEAMKSSGVVKVKKDIDCHIEGRHVIVVEDIIDSGLSVTYLDRRLREMRPASLRFVSLLVKDGGKQVDYHCDYVGFHIPTRFVVGYGLDYAQKFRNLREIYTMD